MSTRNIVLQFTNFQFSNVDRAFIAEHIESQYAPKARQLNATLRQWLRERSYGTVSNVYYDLRSIVEDGVTTRVNELGSVTDKEHDVVTIEMQKVHVDNMSEEGTLATPELGLRKLDETIEFHNTVTNKKHIGILSSLRPLLRDVIYSGGDVRVSNVTGNCSMFQFILPDGGDSQYVNVIRVEIHYHNFMGER